MRSIRCRCSSPGVATRIFRATTLAALLIATNARADGRAELARTTCAALERALDPRTEGPSLLPSYRLGPDAAAETDNLRDVAFTYDNALASIALFACGKATSARRIADALVLATTSDPEYRDGRVRNAYAAGPIAGDAIGLAGRWDATRNAWSQDPYQVSFATGNAAWAALALLDAYGRTREPAYLTAARRILEWTRDQTFDPAEPAGFVGGYFGYAPNPMRQGWKSTEHNVDLAAAWTRLAALSRDARARVLAGAQAAIAIDFVKRQWRDDEGRFLVGTTPDGRSPDHDRSGLDAQLWPLIAIPDPPAAWGRALAHVDATFRVDDGYGFTRRPDGVWTEGTAQAAAVFVLRARPDRAAPLWRVLRRQQTDDGWLFATPAPHIRTGLAIGPDSTTDDFRYYHLPHLAATAWAALAAMGVNPFGTSLAASAHRSRHGS